MSTTQKIFTTSDDRILEMLIIGQMSLTMDKNYIPKMVLAEKEIDGHKVTFLENSVEYLKSNGVYKKNGVNTRELVKDAITDSMENFFDFRYEREQLVAG